MIINLQKLLHLPVYTEAGESLGKVFDMEINIESHAISCYMVRSNFLSLKYFLVKQSQVKEITEEKMVVYEALVQDILPKTSNSTILE
jgi:sporulation protein YlmC with PRC-barrel domain